MSASSLPAGVNAPLMADNPNNHSGLIVIITSFYIVLIIAALIARIYASFQRRLMQHDDFLFGVLVVGVSIQILATGSVNTYIGSSNRSSCGGNNTSPLWLGNPSRVCD
jgi:hypothetical protein